MQRQLRLADRHFEIHKSSVFWCLQQKIYLFIYLFELKSCKYSDIGYCM